QWQHVESQSKVQIGYLAEARFDKDGTLWALASSSGAPAPVQLIYVRRGSRQFRRARSKLTPDGFTLDADGFVVTSPDSKSRSDDSDADEDDHPAAYPVLKSGSVQMLDRTGSVWILATQSVLLRLPARGQRLSDVLDQASPHKSETYDVNP